MLMGLICIGLAWAAPKSVVLKDGSRVVGEVISFDAKGCRLKTEHLGTLSIPLENVVEITPIEAHRTPPAVRSKMESEMMALQLQKQTQERAMADQRQIIMNLLMADPNMAKTIKRLQSQPELTEAMADPSIWMALQTGDIETLMTKPAIRSLLDPNTRKALKKLGAKNKNGKDK